MRLEGSGVIDLTNHGSAELLGDQVRTGQTVVFGIRIVESDLVVVRGGSAFFAHDGAVDRRRSRTSLRRRGRGGTLVRRRGGRHRLRW